jgi:hypothetical protein
MIQAVLGGGFAHSNFAERKQWRKGGESGSGGGSGGSGSSNGASSSAVGEQGSFVETRSDPLSRRRAIERLRKQDKTLVVGITERLDASMVLIALRLGWPLEGMVYESKKTTANLAPSDPRYNVNSGKYSQLNAETSEYMSYLMRDDERVYSEAVKAHDRQAGRIPGFKTQVTEFRQLLQKANGRAPHACEAATTTAPQHTAGRRRLSTRRRHRRLFEEATTADSVLGRALSVASSRNASLS